MAGICPTCGEAPCAQLTRCVEERSYHELEDGWLAREMQLIDEDIARWPAGIRASYESLFEAEGQGASA